MIVEDEQGNIRVEDLWITPALSRASTNDVTLYLFTRNNQDNPSLIKLTNGLDDLINNKYYDSQKINAFIIHGLNNNHGSLINQQIRPAILERYDVNVFVADWSKPANAFYTVAFNAVPQVGKFLGDFIKLMYDNYNINGTNFRLIGHSLGAHISGAVGTEVGGDIEYIVGLDPARPLFFMEYPDRRLDSTDAKFVEVIHTNAGGLGFKSSIGHADFFPNGGTKQTGCKFDILGTCAHSRAYTYFAESIKSSNFLSKECTNYEDFQEAKCDQNPNTFMGQFTIDNR